MFGYSSVITEPKSKSFRLNIPVYGHFSYKEQLLFVKVYIFKKYIKKFVKKLKSIKG